MSTWRKGEEGKIRFFSSDEEYERKEGEKKKRGVIKALPSTPLFPPRVGGGRGG